LVGSTPLDQVDAVEDLTVGQSCPRGELFRLARWNLIRVGDDLRCAPASSPRASRLNAGGPVSWAAQGSPPCGRVGAPPCQWIAGRAEPLNVFRRQDVRLALGRGELFRSRSLDQIGAVGELTVGLRRPQLPARLGGQVGSILGTGPGSDREARRAEGWASRPAAVSVHGVRTSESPRGESTPLDRVGAGEDPTVGLARRPANLPRDKSAQCGGTGGSGLLRRAAPGRSGKRAEGGVRNKESLARRSRERPGVRTSGSPRGESPRT
jgi:hypothetical protein